LNFATPFWFNVMLYYIILSKERQMDIT
jgi:hypothetical protein